MSEIDWHETNRRISEKRGQWRCRCKPDTLSRETHEAFDWRGNAMAFGLLDELNTTGETVLISRWIFRTENKRVIQTAVMDGGITTLSGSPPAYGATLAEAVVIAWCARNGVEVVWLLKSRK